LKPYDPQSDTRRTIKPAPRLLTTQAPRHSDLSSTTAQAKMHTMRSLTCLWLSFLTSSGAAAQPLPVSFSDVTVAAGVAVEHIYADEPEDPFRQVAGGAATADIDGDGWLDLYVIGGDGARQYAFRNTHDGRFVDIAAVAGIAFAGELLTAPVFADIDGDRDPDLFMGTVGFSVAQEPRLLRNNGNGSFTEVAQGTGMFPAGPYTNASFGDYDGDGRLDLFTTHWVMATDFVVLDHLWRNEGDHTFRGVTTEVGLEIAAEPEILGAEATMSFTANFADIDSDGWPDILLASDYGLSQVFRNRQGTGFDDISTDVISDENGMGGAVGDYDNDGHLDWFVTSIFDPIGDELGRWGNSGNRLYRNRGDGSFDDVTEIAGVRDGDWGWGTCFADFDNDGWLDIFHVNGWVARPEFQWFGTPARLFMNNRDGTFTERATEAGIDDRGEGRGVVCFDYDRDGDIDVFISNINGPVRLFRNDLDSGAGFLNVRLVGRPPNTEAVGARISIQANTGPSQMRELRAGSNFLSQDPIAAHFGLADATNIAALEVAWPHRNQYTRLTEIAANQHLIIFEVTADASCDGKASVADLSAVIAAVARGPRAAPCPGGDLNYDGATDYGDLNFAVAQLFAASSEDSPVRR